MKVNEVYAQTRLDQIGTSGAASRPERASVGATGEERVGSQKLGGNQADQVDLSSAGREVQHYLEVARQIPEVRQDKVQEIKSQYDSGNYRVEPMQLAETIVSKGDNIDFLL